MSLSDLSSKFTDIYKTDAWTNGSGPGSIWQLNKPYIRLLENFIRDNNIRSICDVGCGDFQLMKNVDLQHATYMGLDVVPSVIANNRRRYGKDKITFLDMPKNPRDLPGGDLGIVKDVLIHLDNETTIEILRAMMERFRFILTVNNVADAGEPYNAQIESGQFRPVNVSLPPINLPSATILQYMRKRETDPTFPWLVARTLRRYVWPGRKHVQLILGAAQRTATPGHDEAASAALEKMTVAD